MTIRRVFVAAILCLALVSATSGQIASEPVTGANNFHRFEECCAVGGLTTPEAFGLIKARGFKTVINLRTAGENGSDIEGEGEIVRKAGMQYLSIPFSPAAPDTTSVDKFIEAMKDRAIQPVYIHCVSATRAKGLWMVKRVLVDGWTTEKALAEAESLKMTNAGLREFALKYIGEKTR